MCIRDRQYVMVVSISVWSHLYGKSFFIEVAISEKLRVAYAINTHFVYLSIALISISRLRFGKNVSVC